MVSDTSNVSGTSGSTFLTRTFGGPHGSIELGSFYGIPAYTMGTEPGFGFFTKGDLSLAPLGVPIRASFDLGTDVPLRGQRNRVSIALDRQRIQEMYRKGDVAAIASVEDQLTALRAIRSDLYRQIRADSLAQARSPAGSQSGGLNPPDPVEVGGAVPQQEVDTLTPPALSMELAPPVPPETAFGAEVSVEASSAVADVAQARAQLDAINDQIAELERERERLTAVSKAAKAQGIFPRLLQSVRSFQIGNVTPAHSAFLINGLMIEGITMEMASSDLYFAFDRGRSYDDAWRDRSRTDEQLRQLHRTFFFDDEDELAPRKLTSVKLGFGIPESTHVHVGYLNGHRAAVPYGATAAPIAYEDERNDVVELDAGFEVAKGHVARLQLGRSIVSSSAEGASDEGVSQWMDRRAMQNQALEVSWRSRFERTGTDLELAGRAVDDNFHSMGMAFVRKEARSARIGIRQSLGRKMSGRVAYQAEERRAINDHGAHTRLDRLRLQASYRPVTWLTVRSSWAPIWIRTAASDLVDHRSMNAVGQAGWDARWRVGRKRIGIMGDMSRYSWSGGDTLPGSNEAWMATAGASLQCNEHLQFDAGASRFWSAGTDTGFVSVYGNVTGRLKSSEVWLRASGDIPGRGLHSLDAGYARTLAQRFSIKLFVTYCRGREEYFSESFEMSNVDTYSCHIAIGFKW